MSIYKSAVNHPVTTALFFVALSLFGIFSLLKTSISLYPDFDANSVMVMTSYPGASAADVENNLTKLLENSLNGVPNLKNITSKSRENFSIVSLQFEYGTNIEAATNDVRDKLDMVNASLPAGASVPIIFKFSGDDIPVYIIAATAKQSLDGLGKILDEKVVSPLARVKGVGTVTVMGAPYREVNIECDPLKLQAYGLNVEKISRAIAAENRNIPAGSMDIGTLSYAIRVHKEIKDPAELMNIVVSTANGKTVLLKDVATLYDGPSELQAESYTNGQRSATIMVQKQGGANSVDLINAIKNKMPGIEKSLPADIQISTVMDGSINIINSINSLKETIWITLLVVMLVVFVFLGRWRATFIIVLSIPISLLASLMYLYATGNTLNVISMSALSIAIGMVVDDAIVVLENVSTHIEKGQDPKQAAVDATHEVGISVIASTLTMLCVFMPLTMVPGMAGMMFRQLGWIVSLIMIVSTTAALTLVPMLCSRMLKLNNKRKSKLYTIFFTPIDKALNTISVVYGRLITWATKFRKTVVLSALIIFAVTLVVVGPHIKTEFFPHTDQGRLGVTIELPVGTSQEITRQVASNIYNKIMADVPEIQVFNYNFGQVSADNTFGNLNANASYIINADINIGSMTSRQRGISEISNIIRKDLKGFPEIVKFNIQEGYGSVGGVPKVDIDIYGYSFDETDKIAKTLKDKLLATGEFSAALLSRDEYTPEYQVNFDRTKLALNGLTSTTAAQALNAAIAGAVNSYYREDGNEYGIRVRYAPEYRKSLEDLGNVILYTPSGKPIQVKELGTVELNRIPPTIVRKNRERMLTLSGIVASSVALSDAVATAQAAINQTDIPSNISVEISGDFEEQQKMFGDLFMLMIMIVLLVYMVMASQFESFMSPFVIMFSIPFALVGVLWGLWATSTPLGVMGMIGIIILLGIVVKNGIVLIDYTILLRQRGMGVVEACCHAAQSRLRPILMTTLTTVLGMVPMAIGTGEGAEMWRSLGMVVCWGLTISTLITLVLIPTIYCSLALRQERRQQH